MDPNSPVSRLCADGMKAENSGNPDQARELFLQAWELSGDAFESCIAAHYLARHQTTPEETLRWNQVAWRLARASGDDRASGFFPSLLLNLGHSYEELGNLQEARRYYELATERAKTLPADRYGSIVRDGISRGLQRVSSHLE